ncbi:MAG TPA: SxtJ family membrane protein [Acidimicrobiia bacterium]|nr:SxtJ family membrane protein [Acidimicrobiia bacterium]
MGTVILNTNPTRRDLLVFGFVVPLVAAVIGLLVAVRFDAPGAARFIWVVGAALTLSYVAIPPWRRPLFLGWMYVTYPIGWVMSHVALLIVFFLVIVPFGLVIRLARRDLLHRRLDRSAPSYWVRREPVSDVRRYFRQS